MGLGMVPYYGFSSFGSWARDFGELGFEVQVFMVWVLGGGA